jgi:hypothetical protein
MSQVVGAFGLLDFTTFMARSRLVRVLNLMNRFFNFKIFFLAPVNHG